MDNLVPEERVDQVAGGVFLIGLAALFMTGYWWPGIMFVIGASSLARGLAEGRAWYSVQGALWTIGIGLLFAVGFSLPLLLILIGISMLLGYTFKPPMMRKSQDAAAYASYPADTYPADTLADDYDDKPKRVDPEALSPLGGGVPEDEAVESLEDLLGTNAAYDDDELR